MILPMKSAIKYLTLTTSVIAFIIGLIFACNPVGSNIVMNYFLVIMLGIIGIAKICRYLSVPKTSVWELVLGILFIIACFMLLDHGVEVIEYSFGYILAFLAIIGGIRQFFIADGASKAFGDSKAWYITTGIIEILLGILIFCAPIAFQFLFYYLIGVFLVVYAVITFIRGLTIKTSK